MAQLARLALPVAVTLALTGCSGEPDPMDEAADSPAGQIDPATEESAPQPAIDEESEETPQGSSVPDDYKSSAAGSSTSPGSTLPPTRTELEDNKISGTVKVVTAPELAEMQGLEQTPNGEDEDEHYAVLILDSPRDMTFHQAATHTPPTREVEMISLGVSRGDGSSGGGFGLDGEHVTITFEPLDCTFPSDASLPIAEPRCRAYTVL